MKKTALIVAFALLVALFSGCSTQNDIDEATAKTTETTNQTTKEQNVKISVKKEVLAEPESFVDNMKAYGAKVKESENSDEYIFVFSKSEHDKLLKDKLDETVARFKACEDDSEHYIDTVEYDEDFRNMTFYVNKELYDKGTNSTNDMILAASALSYQLYLGSGQKTVVKVIYADTEELVYQFVLPMSLSVSQ